MEYVVPGQQEELKYTAGIQQTITMNAYVKKGKAKSSITTVPGKDGEYELIEITVDLHTSCQATNGKVLSYSGPDGGNPAVNDGDVVLDYNGMNLTFISKAPIPKTVTQEK